MAQFWIPPLHGRCAGWSLLPLASPGFALVPAAPFVRAAPAGSQPLDVPVLLRVDCDDGPERWLLLVPPGGVLWLNGRPLPLGPHLLEDHDELRLSNGQRLYFSTERLPQVEPFPGAPHEVFCARCHDLIGPGTPAVCCPGCGAWCHQTDVLPCWHYPGTSTCPRCEQSNVPNPEFRWTPEELLNEA